MITLTEACQARVKYPTIIYNKCVDNTVSESESYRLSGVQDLYIIELSFLTPSPFSATWLFK